MDFGQTNSLWIIAKLFLTLIDYSKKKKERNKRKHNVQLSQLHEIKDQGYHL